MKKNDLLPLLKKTFDDEYGYVMDCIREVCHQTTLEPYLDVYRNLPVKHSKALVYCVLSEMVDEHDVFTGLQWGFSDTVFRDNVYVAIRDNIPMLLNFLVGCTNDPTCNNC